VQTGPAGHLAITGLSRPQFHPNPERLALPKRISLVMLDDSPPALHGVASRLRVQPGFDVVAVSGRPAQALRRTHEVKPRLVLLHIPRDRGRLALVSAFHRAAPETLLVLTGLAPVPRDLASLIRARISGFVMADAEFGTLLATLYLVAAGVKVLPPELIGSLFRQLHGGGSRRVA
jgi:DNA-binding NarL/FixJ family response regulator